MQGPELAQFLRSDQRTNNYFVGIYPCDRIPVEVNRPCCLVINTDSASEAGVHWVAVYIDAWGKGVYFDSYGFEPLDPAVRAFLKQNTRVWHYNSEPIQNVLSDRCGYYCLCFLTKVARGYTLRELMRVFDVRKPHQNDIRVTQWFHRQYKSKFHRNTRRQLCRQNGILCFRR